MIRVGGYDHSLQLTTRSRRKPIDRGQYRVYSNRHISNRPVGAFATPYNLLFHGTNTPRPPQICHTSWSRQPGPSPMCLPVRAKRYLTHNARCLVTRWLLSGLREKAAQSSSGRQRHAAPSLSEIWQKGAGHICPVSWLTTQVESWQIPTNRRWGWLLALELKRAACRDREP